MIAGKPTDAIYIANSGELEVRKEDTVIGQFKPGQTIGLALAFTGEPSAIDAVFLSAGRYIEWPITNLRRLLDRKPDIRAALQQHVNTELAKRVRDAVLR